MGWSGTAVRDWMEIAGAGAMALLAGYAWLMWRQAKLQAAERGRERQIHEELEAYGRLDVTLGQGMKGRVGRVPATRALAMRVCRTIAEKSAFTRVMLLLRNADGGLRCVGSIGVDDLTVAALERWGEQVEREERGRVSPSGMDAAAVLGRGVAKSIPIALGEWESFDPEVATWKMSGKRERRQWRRAIVMPVRTGMQSALGSGTAMGVGRLVGAIVVCTDGLSVPMMGNGGRLRIDRLTSGLEMLASKLGRTMENEALGERLLRAEKLAGLGQLANGVAHALNNPLTAVLGFAELIAESSSEARVQQDARTIATEALRMKATIERLLDFWRPSTLGDAPVDVLEIVREVADGCAAALAERGVRLEVIAPGGLEKVRGNRERLGQVLEHLMNNAAHAIAKARAREEGEEHTIRISMSQDEQTLYAIVSDTGTGFEDPGRAFDPFYTTRDPVEGAGMGLSICYGIVREHGGEIAAFNLHPHGAAVVVELPLGKTVVDEARVMVEDRSPLTVER
jgi:signal transduction histidine kinase